MHEVTVYLSSSESLPGFIGVGMSRQGLPPSPGDRQRVFPGPPSDHLLQFHWPDHPLHPLPRGRDLVPGPPQSVLEQDLQSVCIC